MLLRTTITAAAGVWLSVLAGAHGAIVQASATTGPSQIAYPASSTDLIQAGSATLAGATHVGFVPFTFNGTTSTASLNDGLLGTDSVNTDTAFDAEGITVPGTWGWTSTYDLDTVLAPQGYAIAQVQTLAGWISDRAGQRIELLFSFVGDPSFVSYGTFQLDFAGTGSSRLTLTDSTGAIASGVDAVRFLFAKPTTSGEPVYREADVFGSIVPEPVSVSLTVLAVGLSLFRRRR